MSCDTLALLIDVVLYSGQFWYMREAKQNGNLWHMCWTGLWLLSCIFLFYCLHKSWIWDGQINFIECGVLHM